MILQDPRESHAAGQLVMSSNTLEELAAILLGDCGETSDLVLLLMITLATRKVCNIDKVFSCDHAEPST